MKKLSLVLLSSLLVLSLVGCSNEATTEPNISDTVEVVEPEVSDSTIAIEPTSPKDLEELGMVDVSDNLEEIQNMPSPFDIVIIPIKDNILELDLSWNGGIDKISLEVIGLLYDSVDSDKPISYVKFAPERESDTVKIDLSSISSETEKIVIWTSGSCPEDSDAGAPFLKVNGGNVSLAGCILGNDGESWEVCEIVKTENGWEAEELYYDHKSTLSDICKSNGFNDY